jgi:glyoxylase-like metal-dependent hydrolase (beta-lactamase superfamily II)
MKPAVHLTEITKNLYGWSSFHPQWKVDFDSFALVTADGIVFVDPLKPGAAVIKKLDALGEAVAILLTNAHHDREADWFRKRYQVQVYAHEKASSDCETKIDILVMDGEKLPGGIQAIHMPGSSAGETAYYYKPGGIVFLGDTLLHQAGKGLSILSEQYCEDRRQARQSLSKLLDLNFKTLTFAHGDPLVGNAKAQLTTFFRKQGIKRK